MAAAIRKSWFLRALSNPFSKHKPPSGEYHVLSSSNGNHDDVDGEDYDQELGRYHRHHKRTRSSVFYLLIFPRACLHHLTLRKLLYVLIFTPFLIAFGVLLSGVPPSYENIRSYERYLPQHDQIRAQHGGGMYLRFPGHLWGHGLNNVMQETILMSYLSYLTNRSFVFEDYVWSQTPFPYTIYDFALRPARMPFNAFISGPTAGGPMPSAPFSHRLAVAAEFYTSACPPSQRHVVSAADAPFSADGESYIQWWVSRLSSVQDHACVEIESNDGQVFDWGLFGEKRLLTLWNGLSHSPILQDFSWSHLVLSAVLRNWVVIRPSSKQALYDSLFQPASQPPTAADLSLEAAAQKHDYSTPGLDGILAVHIRRGDYERHCPRLAEQKASYMGFNQFPSFVDVLDPDGYVDRQRQNQNHDAEIDIVKTYYLERCLPDISQIVDRLGKLKKDHPNLKKVYVLSNAWESWLGELRRELMKAGAGEAWEEVITSNDLLLDAEQRYVGMAVDMAIAERAEVFVGNGFSSLSSNIVMLRMAKGMDPRTNRFL
ncbi:hypothetical protein F5887DRAFT_895963 [Amanita rubescens]|nr:hypothetical protein F5887DRAFT_895963 [Amanita rubescens]